MDPPLRSFHTPPTTQVISSETLDVPTAASHLAAFLKAAESNPLYHPSHKLTPHKIEYANSAQTTSGGDKLRVLGFIVRGMQGEIVQEAREVVVEMGEKVKREQEEASLARPSQGSKRQREELEDLEEDGFEAGIQFKVANVAPVEEYPEGIPERIKNEDDADVNADINAGPEDEQNHADSETDEKRKRKRKEAKKARRKEENLDRKKAKKKQPSEQDD